MNPRERTLAIMVGGLLALAGLWGAVQWGVVDRWKALYTKIDKAHAEAEKTRRSLKVAKASEADWSALRPLSHNGNRAENAFRQDMSQLLEKHGLHEDFTIRPLPQRKLKNEFTEVRLSIQARGHLQQVVNFLCDFYERDYLVRLDQINLTAEEKSSTATRTTSSAGRTGERSGRGRRGSRSTPTPSASRDVPAYGAEGPILNVAMTATALVLPELKIDNRVVAQPTAGEADAEATNNLPRAREEYARIWETNLFKLYQEPSPTPPTDPKPIADAPKLDEGTKEAVVPPPPPRPNKAVVGVTSTEGKLAVFVRSRDDLGQAPEKVEINQEVDDGRLVLVVPQGMVVQVPERSGAASTLKYYFYPLGWEHSFQDRVELDARAHPEIQAQLNKALKH
jgi:hypothetical protein